MYCTNCGKEISADAKVCEFCGISMVEEKKNKKLTGKRKYLAIGGALAGIVLTLALAFGGKTINLSKYEKNINDCGDCGDSGYRCM